LTASQVNTPAGENTVTDVRCLDDASYVLGALTPAERSDFQRHLANCARCQASIRQLAHVQWLLTVTRARAGKDPGRS
jgi:anti-sigma factor RsiW